MLHSVWLVAVGAMTGSALTFCYCARDVRRIRRGVSEIRRDLASAKGTRTTD